MRQSGSCGASFYSEGQLTANGEIFNPSELTAAHKTLPFNTKVRVTNPSSGKSVVVRINDRGPFIDGRCLDLSRAAFADDRLAGRRRVHGPVRGARLSGVDEADPVGHLRRPDRTSSDDGSGSFTGSRRSGMLFRVRTRLFQSGRRPLSPGSRAGLGAALVLLAIVSAVELADGRRAHYIGLLAAVPFLAAASRVLAGGARGRRAGDR